MCPPQRKYVSITQLIIYLEKRYQMNTSKKISYKTIIKNKTLEDFTSEEDEEITKEEE